MLMAALSTFAATVGAFLLLVLIAVLALDRTTPPDDE